VLFTVFSSKTPLQARMSFDNCPSVAQIRYMLKLLRKCSLCHRTDLSDHYIFGCIRSDVLVMHVKLNCVSVMRRLMSMTWMLLELLSMIRLRPPLVSVTTLSSMYVTGFTASFTLLLLSLLLHIGPRRWAGKTSLWVQLSLAIPQLAYYCRRCALPAFFTSLLLVFCWCSLLHQTQDCGLVNYLCR